MLDNGPCILVVWPAFCREFEHTEENLASAYVQEAESIIVGIETNNKKAWVKR